MRMFLLFGVCVSCAVSAAMADAPENALLSPDQDEQLREMYNAYQMGALGKRGGGGSRQNVRDLLRALEMEAELEAEEEAIANQSGEMAGIEDTFVPVPAPAAPTGARDKRRRRRYGFWVTAINKMGNMKRSGRFIPALGAAPKRFFTGNLRVQKP